MMAAFALVLLVATPAMLVMWFCGLANWSMWIIFTPWIVLLIFLIVVIGWLGNTPKKP